MIVRLSGGGYSAVPKTFQQVYVDGVLRKDIEALAVRVQQGIGGQQLSFSLPAATFDADVDSLVGAEIVVYAGHVGESTGSPIFRGLVDSIDSSLAVGVDEIGFSARSWLAYLDRVWLGQKTLSGNVTFRRFNPVTGELYNWTLRSMLEVAFGETYWPTDWAALVSLGDTSPFNTGTASQVVSTDIECIVWNYSQFISHLISMAGDISVRERFTSSTTYLDFYRLGPDVFRSTEVRVAALGEDIGDGANVVELETSRDMAGIATRIIGYTAPRRVAITIPWDGSSTGLQPAWPDATPYGDTPMTAEELAVLDDPDSAKPDSPNYVDGRERIFRDFQLPAALRRFRLDEALPVLDDEGRFIPTQAFRYRPALESETGEWVQDGYETTPTQISIESIDGPGMAFRLGAPAIEVIGMEASGAVVTQPNQRAEVRLTCSLSMPGFEGGYDTAALTTALPVSLSTSQLVESFSRPDLELSQFTTVGMDGVAEYDCTFSHPTDGWTTVSAATSIDDHRQTAARMAQGALRSRARIRRTFQVTLDYLVRGIYVGQTIRVNNGGHRYAACQIQSLAQSLSEDARTIFIATDAIPEEVIMPDPFAGRRNSRQEWKHRKAASGAASPMVSQPAVPTAAQGFDAFKGSVADMRSAMATLGGSVLSPMKNQGAAHIPKGRG